MKAINIQWETDGDNEIKLPSSVDIPKEITDPEEISDYLSDEYGYCHLGFELEEQ